MIHINTLNDWALTVLVLAAIVALTVQLAQRDPLHEYVLERSRGCASENCDQAPVVMYHGRPHCQDCADYLAAADQEYTDQELAAWEREFARGEGA